MDASSEAEERLRGPLGDGYVCVSVSCMCKAEYGMVWYGARRSHLGCILYVSASGLIGELVRRREWGMDGKWFSWFFFSAWWDLWGVFCTAFSPSDFFWDF